MKKMKPVKAWAEVYTDDGLVRGALSVYSPLQVHRTR